MLPPRCLPLVALVLATTACEAPTASTTARPPAPEARAPQSRGPGKPATRRPQPAAVARQVVQEVAWPAASAVDAGVRARFADRDRRMIDAAGVPVLAPRDAGLYADVTVVGRPAWFSVALKDAASAAGMRAVREGRAVAAEGGVSVLVQGNRIAHRVAGVEPAVGRDRVRGRPAWITENESIWSATWEENGITYVAEVACDRPSDARCSDARLLVEVAESLVFVGGLGAVGGAR